MSITVKYPNWHQGECEYNVLATFFNIQISGLAERFLMEIEENVNPGTQKGGFSEIPLGNRKNMQSQIVFCYSSYQTI